MDVERVRGLMLVEESDEGRISVDRERLSRFPLLSFSAIISSSTATKEVLLDASPNRNE